MRHPTFPWLAVLVLAPMLLGVPVPVRAQPDTAEPRTFGTSATVSHTVQAFAFTGATAADIARFALAGTGSRFCTMACTLEAPLSLPAGALVTALEIDGCDQSPTGSFTLLLRRSGKFESDSSALVATIFTGTGCMAFPAILPVPHTIDNANNAYFVQLDITVGGSQIRFQAVRVFYTLQVSPAPAVATFPSDVPVGHPFFQFVEALAQAGITAGCGLGAFCPDSPVTRGQMAVFLSKALGLHFAP
jgi:S-layer homology domain